MCFVQGTPETFAKMDPLTELADVLAENDQLADEKIEWISKQGSFDSTGQCTVSSSQLKCVLALARFLSQCEDPLKRSDLLAVVLEFLKAVPFLASKAAFPRWFNFDSASIYFKEICMYLVKISDSGLADSTSISSIITSIIESLATTQVQTNSPAPRALFYALSHTCPSFHVSHIDQVSSCLLELCLPASTSTPSSRDTSAHGSPFEKKSLIKSMSNGGRSCSQAHTHSPSRESLDLMVLGQAEEQDLKDDSPSSSPSTTPSTMAFSGNIVGRESLEQLTLGRGPNDRAASLHYVLALQEENVDDLQKQETAFRFFVGILERAGSNFLGKDKFLLELRASAGGQLKWVPSILKSRKRDWTIDGSLINTKVNMKLQVCEAASTVYTKCFLLLKADGKGSKNFLRETLALLLDAADACAVSSWRRLRACECLFDHILQNIAFAATSCRSQVLKVLLLRLKTLVLAICAQADPWSKSQGPLFNSIVKTSCDILTTGWDMDRPVFESFLLALATNARERSEQEEKARRVIATMQLNVIRFLANLVITMNKLDIAEIIFPLFVESLEEGDASIPSCLRLQLLDAVARIASMGFEKPYRETVVLLTKSYIDKLSTVGSTQSRTLAPEATTERVETLPGAFLTIASRLTQPKLRADYRHRLLQLCSDVGLDAESKSGKNGADLLGPLLPSVAEICADFNFSGVVAPSLLKLFRNLWFYIVLFGLAPPIQKGTTPSKNVSTSNPSGGSMSAVALQAVTGPYLWNTQWSESVTRIAHGTPPLVGSSVKFVEDELELNELHNPGSRRGNNNEKAAVIQRAALSAALRDHVDMVSMNTMSAVKATYFLAVAFLEILRLKYRGGILATDGKEQQKSALRCVFEYLEKPNKVPSVQQCLTAIAYRAFDAVMVWLDERTNVQRVDANEREAVIATHGCFLISMLAHREDGVRELSCRLLNQLTLKYPQVLWNSACLDALFGLVGTQVLPDLDGAKVGGIRSLLQGQIRNWLIQSIALAPCTSQGLLQEQFRTLNSRPKATYVSELLMFLAQIRLDPTQNEGWGNSQVVVIPAVIAAAAAAAGARPEFTQLGNLEVLSNSIVSANIKSNYIHVNIGGVTFGQGHLQDSVAGIILGGSRQDSMTEPRSKKLNSAKRVLKERLIASFLHHLQQFVSAVEGGSAIDAEAFRETCFRSTAFIVSELDITEKVEMQGFPQLLRLLCWCPAYICSADAIETGIFVWTWLVSAAPQLSALLLAELVDAWLWTIETGRGMFASGVANSGPAAKLRPHLSPGEPVSSGDRDSVEGITAHRLWLGFFFDRFEVVRHNSTEQLSLIGRLLQGSFKKPDHFSSHPAATGAFFSLLLLGLKFCSCQLHRSPTINVGVFLLEDRLHRAALAWFSVDPGWYDLNVKGFSQSEFQAVAIFAQALGLYHTETLTVGEPTGKLCAQEIEGLTTNSLCTQFDSVHPVWGRGENSLNLKEKRKQLLMMLCLHEADRLETWANPLRDYASSRLRVSSDCWSDYMKTAWSVDPRIAFALAARFPSIGVLKVELTLLVQAHLYNIYYIPEALPYFVTPKAVEENSLNLQCLPHWAPCSITSALEFLTPAYKGHPRVMAYVLRVLETYPPETVTFFMPQLVQTLRYDDGGLVEHYLITAAQRSHLFAHILIWQLQGEESPSHEELGKEQLKENTFHDIVLKVKHRIIASFTKEALDMFTREFRFFDKVTDISGALYPLPKEERRAGIRRELEKIEVEGDDLYLPTAPNKLVRGIQLDSGIPLQSAAKVPIMVTFNVVDRDEPTRTKPQACIFKVGDDCRQDVLALQVISLLKDIFQAVNLNLYLFPYGVLPTGCGKGIIEVVPNTRSRNQMGETTDGGLYEVFQQDYGPVGSPQFEAARDNFIVSSAGYAVASLILQPKDRHNGNLLLDNQGRLVHIDFGFILETSPGGNLRFENAQFKLSHEMTQLLDPSKSMKSETWKYFVSLCVKGYLAARLHMDGIINAVLLMVDSGLPCFSRGDPIGNLRKRFHPEMNEWEAANFMKRTCEDAYNKWTTTGYDLIQYLQQGIEK